MPVATVPPPDAASSEADAYRRDGYVALSALFLREIMQAFYEQLFADLTRTDRTLKAFRTRGPLLRHDAIEVYAHQYPPMLTFLWGLTPRIASATGRVLLPTYAYFRIYRQADVCRVHTDRPACEHSLSLTVAYGGDATWPLSVGSEHIATPKPIVREDFDTEPFASVDMAVGDGVLYQGVHRRHGRLVPNPNPWSAHLFLHWVERDGAYADQAFDRPAIERAKAQQA